MKPSSEQRVWFVTGVSTGFGRALAEAILEHGNILAGTVRQPDQQAAITALHPECALGLLMDVTQPEQVATAVQETLDRFGRIDVLVNNAGHGIVGAVEEVSDSEARRVFEVNVFGVLHVIRAVLPHMRARRSGLVINLSSQGGVVGFLGSGVYCATKHALEALSESLSKEAAHLGIGVMLVEPGVFRTDFAGRSLLLAEQRLADYDPTVGKRRDNLPHVDGKQPGDPVRGARAIVQAASEENPPLRLALGPDALQVMREKVAGMQRDWDAWEAISASTNYPPGAG
ncbi:MAG: SDR family NAD(P)-dependent oxidoreductase [Anaerolineae bacterium]|nr:SDR family NAD(P)-dependent oxidoreductase [Anaerolineae bacterium]